MYRSLLQVVNCFGRPSQENTASASRPGEGDAVKAESRFCLNILRENVVFLVKKS